ncbi:MAG: hypothetical protein WCX08_04330 [Candidatus Buchananbacteria bacterium]
MKNKALILIFVAVFGAGAICWYFYGSKTNQPAAISESAAIEIIRNQFPEMGDYPSDNLPPKSIKTEPADGGWYVAFIQEGSGVPVISARCFLVKNDKSLMQRKYDSPGNILAGDFSAKECRVVENSAGGDKDEHGCIGSAGYFWCQAKQKCLRPGEEPCEGNAGNPTCVLETCHGLDIICGANPPEACTMMYGIGDKCLQYAKCGVLNGKCQPLQNPQFTQCKSCVQTCIDENQNNNSGLFECESKCN